MSLLVKVASEFEQAKDAMMSETTSTVDALKLQATIGLLESLIRHVLIFAKTGNFQDVQKQLEAGFSQKLKLFRLGFLKRRLEIDEQSFFGLLRFINEDSIFCADQQNLMIEFFLTHYRPARKETESRIEIELPAAWTNMTRKMQLLH